MDFRDVTVEELAASVRSGERSAREVVQAAVDRIEALDPELNAFVATDHDRSLAQAHALDERIAAGDDPGPLAGVPVGVKDLEAVEGYVTTFGSALHGDDPPAAADCVHVARLKGAGAIIVGKTNTPEFGHKGATDNPLFGETKNPWHLGRSPGGSSGGSAAALAAGMVPLATGSDGGGSIRIPASLCGFTGLKTTQGRIPISGTAAPGSGLLSTNGPMALRAIDTAHALDAVVGPDDRDPLSLPAPTSPWRTGLDAVSAPDRVVWSPTFGFGQVDAAIASACRSAVESLAAEGTTVVERDTIWDEDPVMRWITLWTVSRFKTQGHLIGTPAFDKISPSLQQQIEMGASVSGAEHARALDDCYQLNAAVADALEHASYIVTPTCAGQTPHLGQDGTIDGEASVGWVQFTYGINMTRHPAGTVCVGLTDDGMPIGLQVIGRHHDEAGVLSVLAAIEATVGFDERAPFGIA